MRSIRHIASVLAFSLPRSVRQSARDHGIMLANPLVFHSPSRAGDPRAGAVGQALVSPSSSMGWV